MRGYKPELLGIFFGAAMALFFFSKNIFFILLPLFAILALITFTGNIFAVKNIFKPKQFLIPATIFVVLFYAENALDLGRLVIPINTILLSFLSFSFIMAILIKESFLTSIGLIVKDIKSLKTFLMKYLFRFRLGPILGIILEAILIFYMIANLASVWVKPFMILFWAISGSLFVMLYLTKLPLDEPLTRVLNICQIYGVTRLTYFLFPLYVIQPEVHWLIFSFIFLIFYIGLIYGIQPYIFKSNELKDTLRILRHIYKNKNLKHSHISRDLNLDEETVKNILSRLKFKKIISNSGGKRWSLSERYRLMVGT